MATTELPPNKEKAHEIARKITNAAWVPVAVLAATLFDYPLVFWTLRGMEVGALALFVYTLLWLVLENEDEFSLPRTLAMGALTAGALLIRSDSWKYALRNTICPPTAPPAQTPTMAAKTQRLEQVRKP